MSKNIKEERLRWILPIFRKEIRLCDVNKVCPYSERSLKRWLKAYREEGEIELEPKSTEPKSQPNETPIRIKGRSNSFKKRNRLMCFKITLEAKE